MGKINIEVADTIEGWEDVIKMAKKERKTLIKKGKNKKYYRNKYKETKIQLNVLKQAYEESQSELNELKVAFEKNKQDELNRLKGGSDILTAKDFPNFNV